MVRTQQHRSGFTLVELLITIAIIGTLASIVILAVNPMEQIRKALGQERTHSAAQLRRAIEQFVIEHGNLPGDKAISEDVGTPSEICKLGQAAAGCVNIDEIIPTFVSCIPYDELETTAEFSGYQVYTQNGFVRTIASHANDSESGGGGCSSPPSMVSYWRFDETDITDDLEDDIEGLDGAPNGFIAPQGPSTETPTLKYGTSRSWLFDGSSDYVRVPYDSTFDLTTGLTISAWVNPSGFSSSDNVNSIVRKGEDNPNMWQLAIEDTYLTMMLEQSDGGNGRAQGGTALSAGTWYHVAGTWDGTTATVYVNGSSDDSGSYTSGGDNTLGTDSRDVYIGGRAGTDFFNGYIDDVRIFNEALTASQISKLAAGWPI